MDQNEMNLYKLHHLTTFGGVSRESYSWVIAPNDMLVTGHIQELMAALQPREGVEDHISKEKFGRLNGTDIGRLLYLLGDDGVTMVRSEEDAAYWAAVGV
ncbi:hypothetical protein KBC70_03330 [Candidatus Woesebacteria bacterium]|jgi:hypothetical protein|nr:hypothetical protein [Candidatus Woesebacteria bacterium]